MELEELFKFIDKNRDGIITMKVYRFKKEGKNNTKMLNKILNKKITIKTLLNYTLALPSLLMALGEASDIRYSWVNIVGIIMLLILVKINGGFREERA